MLTLHTLGLLNLRCSIAGEATPILSQPKRFALLVYLAVAWPRGLHRRDTLLTLLWPESGEARARNALSQSLSYLRRNLPEGSVVCRGADEIGMEVSAVIADVVEFQAAVDKGRWAEALEFYGGDFLRGFHVPDAPGFEEWMQGERDRYRDAAAGCAWALAREQIYRGALVEAERTAKRAMTLVCPDEGTMGGFMEAMAWAGDRVAALRLYQMFSARLMEELDLEPTSELEALVERLRSEDGGSPGLESAHPDSPAFLPQRSGIWEAPPPKGYEPSFAGREGELVKLGSFLARVLEGHGTVTFITGEAGTGKTLLSKEFCARSLSTHPDLVVATGYSDAHTGIGDPYHPFREILSLLTGDVEAQWMGGSMSTDHAKRLWSLLPSAIEAIVEVGPDLLDTFVRSRALADRASAFGPEAAQWEPKVNGLSNQKEDALQRPMQATLFDQYARVLRRIARDRPLLLVLEDLQWSDAGSLDLLFHLGRHLEGTKIQLLGLYRPSEVSLGRNGDRHPLEKVANEFQMTLGDIGVALDEEEERAFFEAMIDSEPNALGEGFRDALFRRTRGHAMFTMETLRALQNERRIRLDESGRWVEGSDLNWDLLPAKIEAVIEERIRQLPERLRKLLSVASVEGEQFTLEVAAKVLGKEPMELIPLVCEELEKRHRLVQIEAVQRSADHRLSVYRFRHVLFQKYLYDQLDATERAYYHERVGRALEDLYEGQPGKKALALARHFREAGRIDEAVKYFRQGGHNADRAAAFRESLALFQEAWCLILTLTESGDRDQRELEVLSKLSPMYWTLGVVTQESGEALIRLKALALRLEDDDSLFWVQGCEFLQHFYLGEHENARDSLDEIEVRLDPVKNWSHMVHLHVWRGLNTLNLGQPSRVVKRMNQCEALFDRTKPWPLLGHLTSEPLPLVIALKALGLAPLGFPEKAADCIGDAYALLEGQAHPTSLLFVAHSDLLLRWILKDVEGSCRISELYARVTGAVDDEGYSSFGRIAQGWCAAETGDLGEGCKRIRSGIEELDRGGWVIWRPFLNALLADSLRKIGGAEEALELVDWALDQIERGGERGQEPEVHRIRGEVLLSLPKPDLDGGEAGFRRAISVAKGQEAKLYELRATVSLARLLQNQGRSKEARKILKKCYGWFTEGFEFPDLKEAKALLENLG